MRCVTAAKILARCVEGEGGCLRWLGNVNSSGHPLVWDGDLGQNVSARTIVMPLGPNLYRVSQCGDTRCLSHLLACTRSEQMRFAVPYKSADKRARIREGKRRASSFSLEKAKQVRERVANGEFQRVVAADLGISQKMVSRIVRNLNWREQSAFSGLVA